MQSNEGFCLNDYLNGSDTHTANYMHTCISSVVKTENNSRHVSLLCLVSELLPWTISFKMTNYQLPVNRLTITFIKMKCKNVNK